MLVEFAEKFIGIVETGNNKGEQVELFQKAVDGKAQGEPWCCAFVQYCIKHIDAEFEKIYGGVNAPSQVFSSEHVMTVWNKSKPLETKTPEAGDLIIWQHMLGNKGTGKGHIGIISKIIDHQSIETVEGNTSSSQQVEREGDGVFKKTRRIAGATKLVSGPMMSVMGFLKIWG